MTKYFAWPCPECGATNSGQKGPEALDNCMWCGQLVTVPLTATPAEPPGQLSPLQDVGMKRPASRQETLMGLAFAREVGARPLLDEVQLYFGRPWLTIKYWYRHFKDIYPDGYVKTFPLSSNDRAAMLVEDSTHAWKAEVFDGADHLLAMGYGYAMADDKTPLARGSAVEPVWPWRLAEKRAEEDALRKAVPPAALITQRVTPTEKEEVEDHGEASPKAR